MHNQNNLNFIKYFPTSKKNKDKNSLNNTSFINPNNLIYYYKSSLNKISTINSNRLFPKAKSHLTPLKSRKNKQKIKSKIILDINKKTPISDEIKTRNNMLFNNSNTHNNIFSVENINNIKNAKTIKAKYHHKFNFYSAEFKKKVIKDVVDHFKQTFSPNKLNTKIFEVNNNFKNQHRSTDENKTNLDQIKNKSNKDNNKKPFIKKNNINSNLAKTFTKYRMLIKKIKNYEISKTERSNYSKSKLKSLFINNIYSEKTIQNKGIKSKNNSKLKNKIKRIKIKDAEMINSKKTKVYPLSFQLIDKNKTTKLNILTKNKNISQITSRKTPSVLFKNIHAKQKSDINKLFSKMCYSNDITTENDSKMINYDLGNITESSLNFKDSISNIFFINKKNSELEKTIDQITKEAKQFLDESKF